MRGVRSGAAVLGVVAMLAGFVVANLAAGSQKSVEASNGWVKTPAANATTTTAFVAVDNPTMYDVYLVSATSDAAGRVEFREKGTGSDPQGQAKKNVTIAAFDSLAMEPNGVFLLLSDLKRPLKDGDMVSLTLTTDGGSMLQVSAAVRKE